MTAPATLRRQARLAVQIEEIRALRLRSSFQTPKHWRCLAGVQRDMRLAMIVRALHAEPSISAACRSIGMDRGAFYRDFQRCAGLSLSEYARAVGLVEGQG